MKNLFDISWQVTEPEYRADSALSYSTLAKFAREGFNHLDTLFDKVNTSSLTFGSAVDAIITGGQEEFDNNFIVAEFPPIKDSVKNIVKVLFDNYSTEYSSLESIPNDIIISQTEIDSFQLNWKPETRAKVIKEQGSEYYSLLYIAIGKTILDCPTKDLVDRAVIALKTSPATQVLFADNGSDRLVREYQLKFKTTLDGIDYRCMADLIITDHEKKIVYPMDLKTSSHAEWDFPSSFLTWRYDVQSRLYWRIIRATMDKDEQFKDYELADYTFIVVNKNTLTPLTWSFKDTKKLGTLYHGKNKQYELEDPCQIGQTLSFYLSSRPQVPNGISLDTPNDIIEWIK
jgi:hypothetical protein